MFLVGLTGGIASGKSTVAARWVEHGAIEVDADKVAREVVEPGSEGLKQIRAEFGNDVLNKDGGLDRIALGQIVFNDEEKLAQLNAIVHPLVKANSASKVAGAPADAIVVYNVPLLVEADVDMPFDLIVTVEAPEAERVARLVKHRGMAEVDARARIRAQASATERANQADYILNSNQPMADLLRDADQLFREIENKAANKQQNG